MRIEDVVVGKTYRIRQWDDMEKEFGVSETGSIKCNPIRFVKEMKHLCGKKCVVRVKGEENIYIDIEDSAESNVWQYTAESPGFSYGEYVKVKNLQSPQANCQICFIFQQEK